MATKQVKLQTFVWQGRDKSGNVTKGKLDAANVATARAQLRRQGITPKKVGKESISIFSNRSKAIKPLDIAFFTRQMATMLKSGVPLLQSLEIVAGGSEKDKMKKMLYDIRNDVSGGSDFSTALSKFPIFFDNLYCNLIKAGEQSGALDAMLDRIATYKEKIEALKAKIRKAMTYPIAVVVVGIIVTAILLVKVVPVFEELFTSFGADLPAFTRFVVTLSEGAQKWWFVVLLGIALFGYLFQSTHRKSQKFRDFIDRTVLKIPVLGTILHKAAIARFARTLATTFSAGVPLVEALDSAAGAVGNVVYRNAIIQIRNGVSTGQSLKNAIEMTGVFPNMTIQMIGIGEEAGSLEMMLDKVAEFYEREVDDAVDSLSSLMEPMIMVVLGTLVGGLVVAMYLPIFQLGNVVG
ncbi:type II secretion system F family protein [Marinobacterium sedimentorum]|uniref:type II secretion system F family protein n=1 Tax=Marinobacterium sedimentorum TaxID=2927804 RepID=UPI0020C69D62|nr:type II secretion system F family protein [Marinobacterium sedimentorum]MCP8689564.1 type II secretion system F family protein [Marinobacterium sedimentorum]